MEAGRELVPSAPPTRAIYVLERAFSVPSLIGSLLIITTFCRARGFRKPINRLIFYAAFGNIMSNVGVIMADECLYNPTEAGCQLQAFLIQMYYFPDFPL